MAPPTGQDRDSVDCAPATFRGRPKSSAGKKKFESNTPLAVGGVPASFATMVAQKGIINWRPSSCGGGRRNRLDPTESGSQTHRAGTKLRPSWHTAPGPAPLLNSSILAERSGRAKEEGLSAPYLWSPVQSKSHEQKSELSYGIGTYVNTLSTDVRSKTFQGAKSRLMRTESDNFTAQGSLWCYLVGSNFVVCKGLVVGACRRELDRIARLPVGHRPDKALRFVGLSREAYNAGGHVSYTSNLVTLMAMPDGWILCSASQKIQGIIDLSAVRFCVGSGICLVGGVSVHTCELEGTRMITLQGSLSDRFFATHSQNPLALLPESCRPAGDLNYVTSGNSVGSFHLIVINPSRGFGTGGDVYWRDSLWNHDEIHFTGIMFEVAADALTHSTETSKWGGESQKLYIEEFQKYLLRRFGTIEIAWSKAFDTDGSGAINFTEFGLGCKTAGFVGNVTRLWQALDDDRSGEISIDELAMDPTIFETLVNEGAGGNDALGALCNQGAL